MSAEQLLAALRQLDHSNDNHWTAEGSPRLETVKMLAGGAAVTRDALAAAAPGYSRATAAAYWQAASTDSVAQPPAAAPTQAPPAATSTQPTTPDASAAPGPLSVAAGGTDGQVQDTAAAAGEGAGADAQAKPEDKIAGLEAYHAEGLKFLASLRKERAELDAEIKKTEEALDRVVQEIDKARQVAGVGRSVFMDYLKSQQATRDQRAARVEAMRGVNLKDILPSKAKIDEIFKRRQGHGEKRPSFPHRK